MTKTITTSCVLFICCLLLTVSYAQISTVAGDFALGSGYSGNGGTATSAQLNNPMGIAFDASGNYYIADESNDVIRKVTTAGIISTVAGNNIGGYSGDGGAATAAKLNSPRAIAFDAAGNLYIADYNNNVIRKVTTATGIITTVAGTTSGYSGDGGLATSAKLNHPYGLVFDVAGNMYISDAGNNVIRKVTTATGIITTVAGNFPGGGYSGDGGTATSAQLNSPRGIAFDAAGNLYIADALNNVIREVTTATGIITTVAGSTLGYSGDGGPATSAKLHLPVGIAFDASGNMFIADFHNNVIRKVTTATGIISTIAGDNALGPGYSGDGGPPTSAQLNNPFGLAFDASGNLYFSDEGNNVIRKIVSTSLPVQLISFSGSISGNKIMISWQTASEKNNSFFTIEKSTNGIDFQELCHTKGAINSSLVNSYNCEDSAPEQGLNYYRLKQTDVDGHDQLYKIISVNYTGNNNELQLSPNPTGEDRMVHLSLTNVEPINNIIVYNSLNEIVFYDSGSASLRENAGTYSIQLSPQLSTGIYHLQVNTTSKVFNVNLVL
jgi:sugar lactone lactonase YvrE